MFGNEIFIAIPTVVAFFLLVLWASDEMMSQSGFRCPLCNKKFMEKGTLDRHRLEEEKGSLRKAA